ncbi:alpha/beta fold hydrolase [Halobacillus karajensis]|uniref:AB hydrolase superfamily protein YvaM n=1 Tax=Halobacillus karajensis TaxID=195088 RepID=A0A024P9U7_9BACI|nr:alpha/beta hydrolase [Halobacillus karajensis]CDQ21581.1 AB hydrolase superfamily protein YvaM [Halobacillus karajensis]CDQ25516.1 AB hydrolase superfamily protein YvaM [Halobacillus karajensis]CDQ28954.1 AB hydrolase superfamily protein YvaM [Halobacillus karajensis]
MPYYTEKSGKQLFYEDRGNGEAIVFIHPPGMGRKVFKMQHSLARECRLIFPDLSGNGDSDLITHAPDVSMYSREILQLLDHLHLEKVVITGYSCGGMVAQEFALTYPERTKAIVLAGGFPKVATGGLRFEFLGGMYWVDKSPETLAKLLSHSHFKSAEIKRELNEHMAKSDPASWYMYYNRALSFDCSKRLHQLTMPLLLIYGNKEFWINEHAKYYRVCPNAKMVIIDHAFHQTPATHYDHFNEALIQFIHEAI